MFSTCPAALRLKMKRRPAEQDAFQIGNGLLGAEDRVLAGFRDTELHDLLGRDVDLFAGGRITSDTRLAVHEHQLAETRQRETVLRILVREISDDFEDLHRLLL